MNSAKLTVYVSWYTESKVQILVQLPLHIEYGNGNGMLFPYGELRGFQKDLESYGAQL